MKKIANLLLTAFAALLMVFSSFGSVTAFAQDNAPGKDDTYDIVLTKVKLKDLAGWPKQTGENKEEYTGQKLTVKDYFGTDAETLANVWFDVHEGSATGPVVKSGLTQADGTITFTGLKAGKYYIVEDKAKSQLTSDEQLANAAAVPVEIELPVFKATGGWYTTGTDAVHVYPKNTVDKPTIDKVVNENDKHDTALIGETKTFKITSTMPEGIKDYVELTFSDKFTAGLTYTGNLVVKKGNDVVDSSNYSTVGTDAVGTKGAAIKIAFNEAYIKSLNPKEVITITYDAVINEDAVMGSANPNNVELTYGTNPDKDHKKKTKPTTPPELHTGGAKFEKIDQTTKAKLAGAEFVVRTADGTKFLKQTPAAGNTPAKNEWVDTLGAATVFKSAETTGAFEVKGLPYGVAGNDNTTGETKYQLLEIKAPDGYAKLQKPIEFTISSTTYTGKINQVNNNKVTIPQTGGIGSVAVVAAGLLVVGLGLFLKKRAEQN